MLIDYSVIIRTTGKAGQKYQKLLDSVASLDPAPAEIIVVMPNGSEKPKEQIGTESYYFCEKGMVRQRLAGAENCKTRYALFCDDDVSFDQDFVKKLYEPVKNGLSSFSIAPLYSFLPASGLNAIICTIMGSAVPMIFQRDKKFISILKSSGFSYNRHLRQENTEYYIADSAPWTCFFADIEAFRSLQMDKEIWLDAHGYSAFDDQTMFYKAALMNCKTIAVSTAAYDHLDGKTSFINNNPSVAYSKMFNRVVFWHRFIYDNQHKLPDKAVSYIAFKYNIFWQLLWNRISVLRGRMTKADLTVSENGYHDGLKYIKSEEYKALPKIN